MFRMRRSRSTSRPGKALVPGVSVAAPHPVETILERAYFHIENGGLTLSIVEVKPGGGGTPNEYRFKHELSMHGQTAESSFVLGSSGIVGWMNMALQRVSMKVASIHYDGRSLLPFDKPDVTHANGVEVEKQASLLRIVARYQRAFEFPTPRALHDYLHEHPQADKALHSVQEHVKEKVKSWGERLKSLGAAAKKFIDNAPERVKKFVEDDAHRRHVLHAMHETLENLPENLYANAKKAVKHEAREFATATQGIKAVLRGEKMSDEQKKAVKAVAFDVALTVATAAVTGGLGAGLKGFASKTAESFAKSLAKRVALRSVSHGLSNATTTEELRHFGHGIKHVLTAADSQGDDSDLITAYITKVVADELENLDLDTLAEALEDAASEG